ncbi:hypothetical protein NF27_DK00010 [Candidatus Jidaibacter acanthamoeba]|uniref:Uncharacterized protein n=1 Tax=Candidatus Jidaibacter acanthamoebae TaxID=86105 RepID=A0A0C1MRP0_9RICK|nr:hypothetical protein NF27_FZ00010 [Candidatus Jidaibacter acanthamoeba]KIE05702.1 hypothetical protein NF27_DK00010 [Candidatus Jidaibacter acanthamoeba]
MPLRELANYIETENSATLEGFIKQTYLPGVRGIRESEIAQFLGNNVGNILYLLDGYDEIVPLLRKPGVGAKLGSIVRGIIEDSMAHTIVTSRPARIEHKFDQEYENVGFIDQDIERYVSTFKSERAKEILNFLKNNKSLWGIAHIPINLELICSAWGISGGIDKVSTMSQLYGAITDRLMERYVVKNHAIELDDLTCRKFNKRTQPIVRCLERIAFRGMKNNQIIIPIKEIQGIIAEEEKRSGVGNLLREVLKSGMVKIIGENNDENREIYFLHLSFQEYYAAKYIARAINNIGTEEYKQVYAFISENKYIPYYEVMMWFSAGVLYQQGRARGNYEGLNGFWRIVEAEPRELVGIRHVSLVIRSLEECEASEKVEKHKELINYIKQWIKVRANIRHLRTFMIEILKTTPPYSKL